MSRGRIEPGGNREAPTRLDSAGGWWGRLLFARSCRGGALRGSALWRETNRLELMQRSMAFAALALVTLAPLMLVAGDFDPFQRRFPEWIVDGMGLPAHTAPPVQRLFTAPTQVQGAAGVVGFVASVLFGMSFASAVQGVYLRIWGLPTSSWRALLPGVVATVVVIESWLTGVGFVCFGGALIGHQMRSARG